MHLSPLFSSKKIVLIPLLKRAFFCTNAQQQLSTSVDCRLSKLFAVEAESLRYVIPG